MTPRARAASVALAIGIATCDSALAQGPVTPPTTPPPPAPTLAAPPNPLAPSPYERKGRRDPFDPSDVTQGEKTAPTLASARLTGIVRGKKPLALLETPDGLGYILKLGDTLADGRLIEIDTDRVVFSVSGPNGSTTSRIVLRLPER